MKYSIEIDYPIEKMHASKRRMMAREQFGYYDRTPVNFCLVPRYFTPLFQMDYCDFFQDAQTQYELLLKIAKFQMENIPSDAVTEPVITVAPYFDNVVQASAFGCEVVWPKNETLQSRPVITEPEEMENFPMPEPTDGLWGTYIEWSEKMRELAEQTKVTFCGVEGRVQVAPIELNTLDPHMVAVDLIGTDFYWWMYEYPEETKQFLHRITMAMIRCEEYVRQRDPNSRGYDVHNMAADTSTILSPKDFKEYVVPYDNMIYDRFGRKVRALHMCGDSRHLLRSLVDDIHITDFNLFGYQADADLVSQVMGGKVKTWGNISPMLMKDADRETVKRTALETLEKWGACGGLMLGDGANVCPGTPIENLAALTEAAEEFGIPEGGKRITEFDD